MYTGTMILGIDEVGRGVWAGPLVVGAVVLNSDIDGLTDSKLLSKKRREELYDQIINQAAGVSLGWVSAEEIDQIGLSQALKLATKRAVKGINTPFHEIIIDGTSNFLVGTPLESYVTVLKKADLLISSVSAASIVAKVERDRYMARQDEAFPGYGFKSHVGYGTAAHRLAIHEHGVSPLHRLSIAPLAKYRQSEPEISSLIDADKSPTTRQVGDASEDLATDSLESQGYQILHRNWRTRLCEIDIVARKDDCLYFVEVKHRKNDKAGDGIAAITPKKLRQMKFSSELYVHRYQLHACDRRLVAISTTGDPPQIQDFLILSE